MAEGARLESVYTATYQGFESLPLRHDSKYLILSDYQFKLPDDDSVCYKILLQKGWL